jgi:hypothetical protein
MWYAHKTLLYSSKTLHAFRFLYIWYRVSIFLLIVNCALKIRENSVLNHVQLTLMRSTCIVGLYIVLFLTEINTFYAVMFVFYYSEQIKDG